jgi:hypothetical protein
MALHNLAADGQTDAYPFIGTPAMQPLKRSKNPVRILLIKSDAITSFSRRPALSLVR